MMRIWTASASPISQVPRSWISASAEMRPPDSRTLATARVKRTPRNTSWSSASGLPGLTWRLLQALDDHRLPLALGGAHRLEAERAVERLEIVEQRRHDARARHPERV